VPIRSSQARAEGVQLVVQPLLGDLVLADQAAAMPHRCGQRVVHLVGDDPALTLARQVGQIPAFARMTMAEEATPPVPRAPVE
jgi:hypothetical protein